MCRNIKPLFNLDPSMSDDEVRAAALQYVRKISGFNKPSKVKEAAFQAAADAVAAAIATMAPPSARFCAPSKPKLHRATATARLTEPQIPSGLRSAGSENGSARSRSPEPARGMLSDFR